MRSHACLTHARQPRCPAHIYAGRRITRRVGEDCDLMSHLSQCQGLFEDSHVTPIVREECRWADLDYVQAHPRTAGAAVAADNWCTTLLTCGLPEPVEMDQSNDS